MRHLIIGLIVLVAAAAVFAVPPVPQPLEYHDMADQRTLAGIPHALNVLSNVPFAIVGTMGLAATFKQGAGRRDLFGDPWERWPYAALFAGVALTAFGSSYYHLAPDNMRLVWDRLPMTIGFMGLLTAVMAERVGIRVARVAFVPLLALGAISVGYWWWSEMRGAGDLRLYGVVQFGSLLAVLLLLLWCRSPYADGRYLVAGLVAYGAAKGLETADAWFYDFGQVVSGHTLKHLAAAGGVAFVVAMLEHRVNSKVRSQKLKGKREKGKVASSWPWWP